MGAAAWTPGEAPAPQGRLTPPTLRTPISCGGSHSVVGDSEWHLPSRLRTGRSNRPWSVQKLTPRPRSVRLREAGEHPDAGSSCTPTPSDARSVAQSYSPVPRLTSFGETCHEFQGLAWRPWGLLPPPTPASRHVCVPDSRNPLLSVSPMEQHPGQHRRASGHTTRPCNLAQPDSTCQGDHRTLGHESLL